MYVKRFYYRITNCKVICKTQASDNISKIELLVLFDVSSRTLLNFDIFVTLNLKIVGPNHKTNKPHKSHLRHLQHLYYWISVLCEHGTESLPDGYQFLTPAGDFKTIPFSGGNIT